MAKLVGVSLVVLLPALLVACQQAPPQGGAPAPVPSVLAELRAEGDALVARGDYAAAALRYQAVLNRDPDDLSLRFALGAALSHLGRQGETIDAFRRVVERGRSDSPEFRMAHRWLVSAGVLAELVTFASEIGEEEETGASAAAPLRALSPPPPPGVTVRGRTGPRPGVREVILALAGDDDLNREIAFSRTVKPGQAFEFRNVPPGEYRLTADDADSDSEMWNVPVTVAPGKDLVLDLR